MSNHHFYRCLKEHSCKECGRIQVKPAKYHIEDGKEKMIVKAQEVLLQDDNGLPITSVLISRNFVELQQVSNFVCSIFQYGGRHPSSRIIDSFASLS